MGEGKNIHEIYPEMLRPVVDVKVGEKPLILYPGLYMMPGATGTGKTLNSIALHKQLVISGAQNAYQYTNEARSGKYIPSGELRGWIMDTESWPAPLVIIDSMTIYFLELAAKGSQGAAFKGGLIPEYIVELMRLNSAVADGKRTLIATVNSDLFPVTEVLEGMIEGLIQVVGPGTLTKRDRGLRRWEDVPIGEAAWQATREQLRIKEFKTGMTERFSLGQ